MKRILRRKSTASQRLVSAIGIGITLNKSEHGFYGQIKASEYKKGVDVFLGFTITNHPSTQQFTPNEKGTLQAVNACRIIFASMHDKSSNNSIWDNVNAIDDLPIEPEAILRKTLKMVLYISAYYSQESSTEDIPLSRYLRDGITLSYELLGNTQFGDTKIYTWGCEIHGLDHQDMIRAIVSANQH